MGSILAFGLTRSTRTASLGPTGWSPVSPRATEAGPISSDFTLNICAVVSRGAFRRPLIVSGLPIGQVIPAISTDSAGTRWYRRLRCPCGRQSGSTWGSRYPQMTAFTPKSLNGGSTSKLLREVWEAEPPYRSKSSYEKRTVGTDLSKVRALNQLDLFEQAPHGVGPVKDVPRVIRTDRSTTTRG